jgi:hypothetical protein
MRALAYMKMSGYSSASPSSLLLVLRVIFLFSMVLTRKFTQIKSERFSFKIYVCEL